MIPVQESATRLRKFRPDIEGFRAVAILMVVIHHAGFSVFGGVDISFVLSGFLATSVLLSEYQLTRTLAFGRFYARRARRLLPLATVVIVATLLATWLWLPVSRWESVAWDGLSAALWSINYRLAAGSTDYFAENAGSSPLQHFWSLAVEEQFYLFWPLLFVVIMWVGRKIGAPRWVLGTTLAVIGGASLYLSIVVTQSSQPWAYFGFHTRAWELLAGALLAVAAPWLAKMWQSLAAVMSWGGLVVIGVGSVMISKSTQIPGSVMLWPVLGAAMVIAGGCAAPRFGAEVILARRLPRFLGRVSYGWYLWHWPALIVAPFVVGRKLTWLENLAVVGLALGLAIATFYAIEKPLKSAVKLVAQPRSGLAFGGRFVAVSVVAVGALLAGTVAHSRPVPQSTDYAQAATIQQQIAEAVQATSLPVAVSRQLASAKEDLYPGCIAQPAETQANPCTLGDPNGTDHMVLTGSSLAWQWIPAFNKIAKDSGRPLSVFTKGACPAEKYSVNHPTTNDGGKRGLYTECDTWRNDAYSKIAALKPKLVIMSSRVEMQATPAAIRDSVKYFQQLGARVVVLGETPSLGFNGPECLSQRSPQACAVDRNTVFADRSSSDMAAVEARAAGATVIDPNQWLCTATKCPATIGNKLVYWDDHHMTASFTRWLSPLLKAALP